MTNKTDMKRKYFTKYKDSTTGGSKSFYGKDFKEYWESLTEDGRNSLRDKAKWEHMTLSAVAIEYGAIE